MASLSPIPAQACKGCAVAPQTFWFSAGIRAINNECPLNVKGAEAKVRQAGEHLVVEVTARDAAAALEILKRARALLPHPSLTAR